MTFQEFLASKRALAIVEHMQTLSEADARELFESLDNDTIELIEQLLDESATTVRKVAQRHGENSPQALAAKAQYFWQDRENTISPRLTRNISGGYKGMDTASDRGQRKIRGEKWTRSYGSEAGRSERRKPGDSDTLMARYNIGKFRQGTQASKYPTQQEALEIIDLASTLSESQAIELFEGLDDSMIELIEQLLGEGSRGEKKAGRKIAAIRNKIYPFAFWHGEGDGAKEMEKAKQLRAQHDNVITGLRGSGRNVRGVLRAAETIRNRGRRTSYDEPGLKGAELQQHVDAMRKARGEEKQKR
jgi:hypothetical protein